MPQVTKERRRNAPQNIIRSRSILRLLLLHHFFGLLSVNYFMISCLDITASNLFEHDSGLEKQAAVWDGRGESFHISSPKKEAGVPALAMNSNEVEVIVKTSKVGTDIIFSQIRSSRCQ